MLWLTADLPDLDASELRERLSSKRGFVWLKRDISAEQQREKWKNDEMRGDAELVLRARRVPLRMTASARWRSISSATSKKR